MSDLKYVTEQAGYEEWWRSWRQTIDTPLGGTKTLTAHIERIRVYEDGTVQHIPEDDVVISVADIRYQEEGLDALEIQNRLTSIIGRRILA